MYGSAYDLESIFAPERYRESYLMTEEKVRDNVTEGKHTASRFFFFLLLELRNFTRRSTNREVSQHYQ